MKHSNPTENNLPIQDQLPDSFMIPEIIIQNDTTPASQIQPTIEDQIGLPFEPQMIPMVCVTPLQPRTEYGTFNLVSDVQSPQTTPDYLKPPQDD